MQDQDLKLLHGTENGVHNEDDVPRTTRTTRTTTHDLFSGDVDHGVVVTDDESDEEEIVFDYAGATEGDLDVVPIDDSDDDVETFDLERRYAVRERQRIRRCPWSMSSLPSSSCFDFWKNDRVLSDRLSPWWTVGRMRILMSICLVLSITIAILVGVASTGSSSAATATDSSSSSSSTTSSSSSELLLWEQLGGDVDGETARDRTGGSVALSADGDRLIVGGDGSLRVYDWTTATTTITMSSGEWSRTADLSFHIMQGRLDGDDRRLDGPADLGLALTPDGNLLVVGDPWYHTDYFHRNGAVTVFRRNITSAAWSKLGNTVVGEEDAHIGRSVDVTGDGRTLVVSAHNEDSVHAFELDDGDGDDEAAAVVWSPRGSLHGERYSEFGRSLSVSRDGATLLVGAPLSRGSVTGGEYDGSAFFYDLRTLALLQREDGNADSDRFGGDVSLSADGSLAAIGTDRADYVRILRRSTKKASAVVSYEPLRAPLAGAARSHYGRSVRVSANGGVVAIGGPNDDEGGTNRGRTFLYVVGDDADRGAPEEIGAIVGESLHDKSGVSVALSATGHRVAIGSRFNVGGGDETSAAGHVRVYEYQAPL